MPGLGRSIFVVALVVAVLWLIGRALGFHVSLFSALLVSVVLTLLLNLIFGAFARRRT
jgi:hypothetical protein